MIIGWLQDIDKRRRIADVWISHVTYALVDLCGYTRYSELYSAGYMASIMTWKITSPSAFKSSLTPEHYLASH